MKSRDRSNHLTLDDTPTEQEINLIESSLLAHNRAQTNGAYDEPGIEINLALKDREGEVVGGICASTMLRVMYLETLWVDKAYRGSGYGRELVLAAERAGFDKGCITSHTWTFSFQAPEFHQKTGYGVLGIYDGYPDGITEYVLMKRLRPHHQAQSQADQMQADGDPWQFSLTADVTKEDMQAVSAGLGRYVDEQVGEYPRGHRIKLVAKDCAGQVVGGLLGYTTLRNLVLEQLWLDRRYRGLGWGAELVTRAERIAQGSGCIACQTYCLSFQNPGFFERVGFETFGVSDGYPDSVREYYLIKHF